MGAALGPVWAVGAGVAQLTSVAQKTAHWHDSAIATSGVAQMTSVAQKGASEFSFELPSIFGEGFGGQVSPSSFFYVFCLL